MYYKFNDYHLWVLRRFKTHHTNCIDRYILPIYFVYMQFINKYIGIVW